MFSSTQIASSREFTQRLSGLLGSERTAMADFIAALSEFDRKRLWEPLGYNGLFSFLRRELGMSTGAAYYRKVAAELVRKCPEVLDALRSGKLCITAIPHLARVLTADNRGEVLPRFLQTSRREARQLAAELDPDPNPPTRDVVTQVRSGSRSPSVVSLVPRNDASIVQPPTARSIESAREGAESEATSTGRSDTRIQNTVDRAWTSLPSATDGHASSAVRDVPSVANQVTVRNGIGRQVQRDDIEPLTAERSRLHTTVSNRCLRLLEAARAALSHSHPKANAGDIMEAALGALLAEVAKRKRLVARPRSPKPKNEAIAMTTKAGAPGSQCGGGVEPQTKPSERAHSRVNAQGHEDRTVRKDIPAHVERAVRVRDQERCQWQLASGGICGETHEVQVDHVVPVAMGGSPTVDNLRLLCRQHNLTAARIAFGEEFMARFTGERREVSD